MSVIIYMSIEGIDQDMYQLMLNNISYDRRKRAERYYFADDSKRSVCTELLLQYSLFQTTKQSIEIDLIYNKFGKPFIKNMKDFYFNISHSGKWVVLAYGEYELGVDIEQIRNGKEEIALRYFTEEENRFIQEAKDIDRAKCFTQIWTLKESYIKYIGAGLSIELDSFSVDPKEGVITDHSGRNCKKLHIQSIPFDEDYYLAYCTTEYEVEYREISLNEIIRFIKNKNR